MGICATAWRGGGTPYERLDRIDAELNFIKTLLLEAHKDNLNYLFDSVYKSDIWVGGSGPGSDPELCKNYIAFLQEFFKENNIQSIVDCGCGDWQFSQYMDFSGIDYQGFDVAAFVVSQNNARFQKENVHFHLYDGDFLQLPAADLLICKDVLQHLDNQRIQTFIRQLPRFKFAILTNDICDPTNPLLNADITSGSYRPLDLRKAPFSLDLKIVLQIDDGLSNGYDKTVMLWVNPQK